MNDYADFLRAKVRVAESWGLYVHDDAVYPLLKPHHAGIEVEN